MAPADRRRLPAAAAALLVALAAAVVALAGPAAAAAGSSRLEPKGAKVTLQAKWQGTPLLHEAAEFLVSALWPAAVAGPNGISSCCRLLPPARPCCCWRAAHAAPNPKNRLHLYIRRLRRTQRCSGGLWKTGSSSTQQPPAAAPAVSSAGRRSRLQAAPT